MKTIKIFFLATVIFAGIQQLTAQEATKSISKTLGVYIFPTKDQDQKTQEADEAACYKWAMEQTGYDPLNPTQVQAAQVNKGADGTAVVGAAAGAAIGAIAGDAGKGAAIGAVVGGLRGRRAKVVGDQKQQAANNAAADAKEKEMINEYKKAFSACMEGKGYTVK